MSRCFTFLLLLISLLSKAQSKEFFDEFDNLTEESKSLYYEVGMKREFIRMVGMKTYPVESYVDTVYTYFTKDNKLRSKVTYAEGYRNGPYSSYHKNGSLKQTGQYYNDLKKGVFRSWYPDGRKQMKVEYAGEGAFVNHLIDIDFKIMDYWDSLGNPVIIDGNGTCTCSFTEERHIDISEAGKVVAGFREGEWKGFSSDTLLFEDTYSNGKFIKGIRHYPGKYAYGKLEVQAEYK